MGLRFQGVVFPYTEAERDSFDPANVAGDLPEMDALTQKKYGTHLAPSAEPLETLLMQEGIGVVLNGLSPRRIEYYTNYRYYRSYKKYYGALA